MSVDTAIFETQPDWRALARRARVPALVAGAVVAGALVLGGPAQAFADALGRAASADPRWFAGAILFEALSFVGYVALLWHVAGRSVPRFGLRESYQTALAGAAVTRLLPTAGAGGAALTLWTLRKAGHGGREAARTLLTFLVLLYTVFLSAILVAGAVSASGHPFGLTVLPASAAALAITIAIGVALRGRETVLGAAVRDAVGLLRGRDPRLLGAIAWWGFDVAVLWAAFNAIGTPPHLGVLVIGYFLGQVANTIPIPGAASGGLVGVLLAFGVAADVALASVLAYRAIAIWLPAPAGAHAFAGLRRTVSGWAARD